MNLGHYIRKIRQGEPVNYHGFVAFDYDLGGLRIYSSLRARLGEVLWVQPSEWQSYQGLFRMKPKSTERALQAIELARQLGFEGLARTFRETGHFMEQEMILEHAVLSGESE